MISDDLAYSTYTGKCCVDNKFVSWIHTVGAFNFLIYQQMLRRRRPNGIVRAAAAVQFQHCNCTRQALVCNHTVQSYCPNRCHTLNFPHHHRQCRRFRITIRLHFNRHPHTNIMQTYRYRHINRLHLWPHNISTWIIIDAIVRCHSDVVVANAMNASMITCHCTAPIPWWTRNGWIAVPVTACMAVLVADMRALNNRTHIWSDSVSAKRDCCKSTIHAIGIIYSVWLQANDFRFDFYSNFVSYVCSHFISFPRGILNILILCMFYLFTFVHCTFFLSKIEFCFF